MQDVEKELEVQIGMKQEMELSMKMLEKDICEKQDALVELRQQLEDLRAINQQLSHKSQVSCSSAFSGFSTNSVTVSSNFATLFTLHHDFFLIFSKYSKFTFRN